MESRKYQLQKQIIEAQNANDNDLYSLLKSQWAHRFGVESLEELKNLDLNQLNQNFTSVDNQKTDQSQDNLFEKNKPIAIKEEDNQKKQITTTFLDSINDKKPESFKTKSYEIVNKENYENKTTYPIKENKNQTKIQALIPIPPIPKYGYLNKWLLRK